MTVRPQLVVLTLALAAGTGCGWLFGSDEAAIYVDPAAEVADDGPKCRPAELDARGEAPYKVGDTTPSGWTVTAIEAEHEEYVRVALEKEGAATKLEFAFNADGAGDWATDKYRLMPAPEAEPPPELLQDAITRLREHAAAETGPPFVRRTEGIADPFEGLPPCP